MMPALRHQAGLARSASLLRALGPSAAPVWAELDPADAAAIAGIMDDIPDTAQTTDAAANALLREAEAHTGTSIWQRLSALPTTQLGKLLEDEHPQLIALTLSRLEPQAAAALVRQVPGLLATDILHRMLHISSAHNGAVAAIERSFETRLDALEGSAQRNPDETVARIFDALPAERSQALLDALQKVETGASDRVRALMFTFEDIAGLPPAGLQTLLARADRAVLTLALKGETGAVGKAFSRNMTARAREALAEDIAAEGARTRFDIDAARAELVALARALIDAGDIRASQSIVDEELIE